LQLAEEKLMAIFDMEEEGKDLAEDYFLFNLDL
jgi:hypothetical protein